MLHALVIQITEMVGISDGWHTEYVGFHCKLNWH